MHAEGGAAPSLGVPGALGEQADRCARSCGALPGTDESAQRPRLRDLGVSIGILAPGPLNAITDVEGVRVGQVTLIRGDNVRTGVTVVLPHAGNLFQDKVAGAIFVGNGFGKITGTTQVDELGEIETPIVLTSTLNVPRVADALLDYMLALPGNENVRSINPLIAETNDGILNDARSRPVSRAEVFEAIRSAAGGAVAEGSVGAGTGTIAFGFKGGIGTASRRLPTKLGGYTVGVLAQTNFGGNLTIAGVPIYKLLQPPRARQTRENERFAYEKNGKCFPLRFRSCSGRQYACGPLARRRRQGGFGRRLFGGAFLRSFHRHLRGQLRA